MVIKVCDAIMGSGKSSAAIRYINENKGRYIYITPYLKEVKRVRESCKDRFFVSPEDNGAGKLLNLHFMLESKYNISSTHALFSKYDETTKELIRKGEYTLILDEVFNVLEPIDIKQDDIDAMFKLGFIQMDKDGEHVNWVGGKYKGDLFDDIMHKAKSRNLIYYKEKMMFWTFPVDIFTVFKEAYVLTYLFDAQIQKYYYDMNGIEFEKIGVEKDGDGFKFGDTVCYPEKIYDIKNKVHILEHEKMNSIGDKETALSASWYQRNYRGAEKPVLVQLKKNLYNYFRNLTDSDASKRLWTTYKKYEDVLGEKSFKKSFIPCSMRATNDYKLKNTLAYCVNIYFNPMLKGYFTEKGVAVKEDEYALSELLQWIWRSAIREYEDIWIYIPSSRMRKLLKDWIDSINNMKNN